MLSRKQPTPYPALNSYSTKQLKARLLSFRKRWTEGRRGGMRLDSFSALYLAGELDRVQTLINKREWR